MTSLYVKHLLIRTPLERPAQRLREFAGIVQRLRYPELHETYIEGDRIEEAMRRILIDNARRKNARFSRAMARTSGQVLRISRTASWSAG